MVGIGPNMYGFTIDRVLKMKLFRAISCIRIRKWNFLMAAEFGRYALQIV